MILPELLQLLVRLEVREAGRDWRRLCRTVSPPPSSLVCGPAQTAVALRCGFLLELARVLDLELCLCFDFLTLAASSRVYVNRISSSSSAARFSSSFLSAWRWSSSQSFLASSTWAWGRGGDYRKSESCEGMKTRANGPTNSENMKTDERGNKQTK